MKPRTMLLFWILLATATAAALAVGLMAGGVPLLPHQLMSREPRSLFDLHLARTFMGLVAGSGLCLSGAILQAVLRNPLAEPYILGISSGGGLGAAVAIVLGLPLSFLPILSFLSAFGASVVVYRLALISGRRNPQTLILSGVVVGAILSSLLLFIIMTGPGQRLHNILWWLLGDLQVSDWPLLKWVVMTAGPGMFLALLFSRQLDVLSLGEEQATALGMNVERVKMLFLLLATLITGAVVAACGLIGFIGLVGPHLARVCLGPSHRRLLPASMFLGAALLLLSDAVAQTILSPRVIPIGVVTTLMGGPFFLVLLRRQKGTR